MENKWKIKIFGIGAAVLLVLVAFGPASTSLEQSSKEQPLNTDAEKQSSINDETTPSLISSSPLPKELVETDSGNQGSRGMIYVDDDRPPEWYDATHVKTIQEGVDNASAGDTVFVYNGTYNERVTVDKSLNLTGENRDNTIINNSGSGKAIDIESNYVNISNFTIENGNIGIYFDNSDNCSIRDCKVNNIPWSTGIWFSHSHDNVVENCKIENEDGIYLDYSDSNEIRNCEINNTDYAINFYYSNDNVVEDCIVENVIWEGFSLWDGDGNIFRSCEIRNVTSAYGIRGLSGSDDNVFENCSVENGWIGISFATSDNNSFRDCNVTNATYGFKFGNADENSVERCNIANCSYGLYLNQGSDDYVIRNCSIVNTSVGVYLSNSFRNVFQDNTFTLLSGQQAFDHSGYDEYDNNQVYPSNTVNGADILLMGGVRDLVFDGVNAVLESSDVTVCDLGIVVLYNCSNITIQNSRVSYHSEGVNLSYCDNSSLVGCTVEDGSKGVNFYSSVDNLIYSCTIINNTYGVYLTSSSNNTIYDNIFNNTNNAIDNSINNWNISKTLGLNIIHGPYLGGNYWNNYTGEDADFDGIGDTPYNVTDTQQDHLPLVKVVYADLSGCGFNVTSDSLNAYDIFNVEFQINNTGEGDTFASFDVSFYLSYNQDISIYDQKLGKYTVHTILESGNTTDILTKQLQLPHSGHDAYVCDGWYYIGMIIDIDDEIWESDETNNANTGFYLDYEGTQISDTDGNCEIVDLDVDSDNNNQVGFPDRSDYEDYIEEDEFLPGKYVKINVDDDDGNLELDQNQDEIIEEEQGELVPLLLEIGSTQANRDVQFQLSYSYNYIRVWPSPYRGNLTYDVIQNSNWYNHTIWILGDMNNDSTLDEGDRSLFEDALDDDPGNLVGDMNVDGVFNLDDWPVFNLSVDRGIIRYVPVRLWIEGLKAKSSTSSIWGGVDFNDDDGFDGSDNVEISLGSGCDWRSWPDYFDPSVPPGYNGSTNDYISKAYSIPAGADPLSPSRGSLQLSMWQAFGPGDFPPISLEPEFSTAPMVSKGVRHFQGPTLYQERPTHNDIVDLVTEMPLIQETDFELPFGSATFRHIRTYSENIADHAPEGLGYPGRGTYWDWNGRYWMMSENPIFLIDARWPSFISPLPKRCYFILDAHHAIPFIWDENLKEYIAPLWFDAILTYDDDNTSDDIPPSQWHIYLNQKTIKYTITPVYEDVWFNEEDTGYVSAHESGDYRDDYMNPYLHGIPYYGLVTQIKDAYGNRMEYEYNDFYQSTDDDPSTDDCVECWQNGNEKGQLKSIRLITKDNETSEDIVAWTLFYVHRAFGPDDDIWMNENRSEHLLHSIYVYKGNKTTPAGSLTIGSEDFCNAQSLEDLDEIGQPETLGLPSDWVIAVKYLHSDVDVSPCTSYSLYNNSVTYGDYYAGRYFLLKTTAVKRALNDTEEYEVADETFTLHRYEEQNNPLSLMDTNGLKAIYFDDTITGVINALEEQNPEGSFDVNSLINLSDDDLVPFNDSVSGEIVNYSFIKLADLYFHHWDMDEGDDFAKSNIDLNVFFIDEVIGGDPLRTSFRVHGKERFEDRRSSTGRNSSYLLFSYLKYPSWMPADPDGPYNRSEAYPESSVYPSVYHFPYHLWNNSGNDWDVPPLDESFYVTIVDEVNSSVSGVPYGDVNEFGGYPGLLNRRVVEMNPSGFVLRDRMWSFEENSSGVLVSQVGFVQTYQYDSRGKLLETRSTGWNSPDNPDPSTNGSITRFTYEDYVDYKHPGELKAVGIKQGTDGEVYYVQGFEHNVSDRSELLTKTVKFPGLNVTDVNSSDGEVVEILYDFNKSDCDSSYDWKIVNKTIVRSPVSWTADDSGYYAVEKEQYDDNGNLVWWGVGSVGDPMDIEGTAKEFFVDYSEYDNFSRVLKQVVDVDPGKIEFPDGFTRVSVTPALHLVTRYWYDDIYGLVRTQYPNGREQHNVYMTYPGETGIGVYQWVYKDVIPGNPFEVLSPVEINRFEGSRLIEKKVVTLNETDDEPSGNESYTVLSVSMPSYDQYGRIVEVKQQNEDGSVSGQISYDDYVGQIARVNDTTGTITRSVYDPLGRPVKTYLGTHDVHPFWGNADPWDEESWDDNMRLTKKNYFAAPVTGGDGSGVRNAGMLIQTRQYREKPFNQYFDTGLPSNNEDEVGWAVNFSYNWRMRNVVKEYQDSSGMVLKFEVSWLDNLNRERFVAVYNSSMPSDPGVDPRELDPGDELPNASAILNASPLPLTLQETMYNSRGLVEEERVYNVSSGSNASYISTMSFYDHNNNNVEMRSPNAPVERFVYDGKKRLVNSSSIVTIDDEIVELSHTDTVYDKNDRSIKAIRWERLRNATGNNLTSLNSVRTFYYSWYDESGRVVASADYGTNNSDNVYVTGEEPAYTEDPPGCTDDGPRVTQTEYDEEGRVNASWHPDGTVTTNEYDNFGRLLLTIENAGNLTNKFCPSDLDKDNDVDMSDFGILAACYNGASRPPAPSCAEDVDADLDGDGDVDLDDMGILFNCYSGTGNPPGCEWRGDLRRRTGYYYDNESGQLLMMAAVLPSHNGGIVNWSDINWSADDESIQVTRFAYNATIVNGTWNMPSYDHGWTPDESNWDNTSMSHQWISDVWYPNGDHLSFTYYSDGSVASRTDEKNTTVYYAFDELGRLNTTWIDDSGYYDPLDEGEPGYAPSLRIQRITNGYTPDDLLARVTAYSYTSGGESVVSENRFSFDGWRNLLEEWQAHKELVDGETPSIQYVWESSSADNGSNFNRLQKILYPGGQRELLFHYGSTPGDMDDLISRVTGINDSVFGEVVNYTYAGEVRRVGTVFGNNVTQKVFDTGIGYSGLDRFGRIKDLHFKNSSDGSVHRYQYGYDVMGNRLYARVDQSGGHVNDRSWHYEYDILGRLDKADMGNLSDDNDYIRVVASSDLTRYKEWLLDNLGNWAAGDAVDGSVIGKDHLDANRMPDHVNRTHHVVDVANRVLEVNSSFDGTPENVALVYDGAGNVVCDGEYFYQYDGLNRLVQVNESGSAVFDDEGRISGGVLGDLVVWYVYDGLGRLITRNTSAVGREFFYDGIRRVQEVDDVGIDCEYVYGVGYVDEFVLQVNDSGDAVYMLQDANYDVVALLDDGGGVLVQYTQDPYGSLVFVDEFVEEPPSNVVGHHGLFFERFDQPDNISLEVGSTGLYYNRNRWYSPELGRFVQRDPNEAALPIVTALVMNGMSLSLFAGVFNPQGHYGDGLNLYEYLGGNPLSSVDPLGSEFSFAGQLLAHSIVTGLVGAAFGSIFAEDPWSGALAGFVGGFTAGSLAFVTSASILITGATYGGLYGATYSAATSQGLSYKEQWERFAIDTIGGAILGGLFAGALGRLGRRLRAPLGRLGAMIAVLRMGPLPKVGQSIVTRRFTAYFGDEAVLKMGRRGVTTWQVFRALDKPLREIQQGPGWFLAIGQKCKVPYRWQGTQSVLITTVMNR